MMTRSSILHIWRRFCPATGVAAALLLGVQFAHADSAMQGMSHMDDTMSGMRHPLAAEKFAFGQLGERSKVDRTVTITTLDMRFEPKVLKVKTGETIRFVVMNKSDVDHDFTIGDAATQTAHRTEMLAAMGKGAKMHHDADPNAISIKAGQVGELVWKFSRAGQFEFDCNVPGHYEAGMKGTITVGANGA